MHSKSKGKKRIKRMADIKPAKIKVEKKIKEKKVKQLSEEEDEMEGFIMESSSDESEDEFEKA